MIRSLALMWRALLVWLLAAGLTHAEPRLALLIGNGGYTAVDALANPPADARLMAGALEASGFTVTLVTDADLGAMRAAVTRFGADLRAAGPEATGLFYYAGHGVQSFGRNYLLPVDARLSDAADLALVGLEAETVLLQMASARNRTNIVILDACRNNPFQNVRDLGDNGLAEMKAPSGTFLAYATEPGAVALDGADGNSPFTAALARVLMSPGLPVEQVFKHVRIAVIEATAGRQTPWDTSSLTADFSFTPKSAAPLDAAEEDLWRQVSQARDPVQLMLFLRAYPLGRHHAEAAALLAEVQQAGAQQAGAQQAEQPPPPEVAAGDPPPSGEAGAGEAGAGDTGAGDVAALATSFDGAAVAFSAPLTIGPPELMGRSLEQLLAASPLYPPLEGLPDEVWKDKPCAACHQWTKANLCDQAKVYLKEPAERAVAKQHPLGGAFKLALRSWATEGCP